MEYYSGLIAVDSKNRLDSVCFLDFLAYDFRTELLTFTFAKTNWVTSGQRNEICALSSLLRMWVNTFRLPPNIGCVSMSVQRYDFGKVAVVSTINQPEIQAHQK